MKKGIKLRYYISPKIRSEKLEIAQFFNPFSFGDDAYLALRSCDCLKSSCGCPPDSSCYCDFAGYCGCN